MNVFNCFQLIIEKHELTILPQVNPHELRQIKRRPVRNLLEDIVNREWSEEACVWQRFELNGLQEPQGLEVVPGRHLQPVPHGQEPGLYQGKGLHLHSGFGLLMGFREMKN